MHHIRASDGRELCFRVEATDSAGNTSADGPTFTLNLSDQTPPVWSMDASYEDGDADDGGDRVDTAMMIVA